MKNVVTRRKLCCFALLLPILLCLAAGCHADSEAGSSGVVQASQASDGNFLLTLYTDQNTYSQNEPIKIWATLAYIGKEDQATVWHDIPCVNFRISDGKKFDADGVFECVLTSSVFKKNKIYTFNYIKSGGYDADGPDAAFWKKFYDLKELVLPKGVYTVTAIGSFSLTQCGSNDLRPQLMIRVKYKKRTVPMRSFEHICKWSHTTMAFLTASRSPKSSLSCR